MRNKQHLIALDLDGTLLTDAKEISQHTKNVLRQAIDNGHIVVIATGRARHASIQYYQSLGLNTPMLNSNGAFLHHPRDHEWGIFHNPMPHQTALSVIDACYQMDVRNILAEVQDRTYLDRHDQQIIDIFQTSQADPALSPFTIGKIGMELKDDPTSLLIHPKEEHIIKLQTHLDAHVEFIEHRNWGAPWNIIEVTKKGVHKAFGLKKIADYFKVPRERIIAFGDEGNDLEMIDYAGIGVAMENGIDELKSIANYTTGTNEQDGVSNFLEKYLKLNVIAN